MLNTLNFSKFRCNRLRCFNLFWKEKVCLSRGTVLHESTLQGIHLRNLIDEEDDVQNKIVHNTKLVYEKTIGMKKKCQKIYDVKLLPSSNETPPVLALKYFNSTDENFKKIKKADESINLPYRRHFSVKLQNTDEEAEEVVNFDAKPYNANNSIFSDEDLPIINEKDKSCEYAYFKYLGLNYQRFICMHTGMTQVYQSILLVNGRPRLSAHIVCIGEVHHLVVISLFLCPP